MVEKVNTILTIGAACLLGFIAAMIVQCVFLFLKIFGAITWGWVWVLLPVIIVAGMLVLLALFLVIYAVIVVPEPPGPDDIDAPL